MTMNGNGRPTAAEQVVEEPKAESQQARWMPRIRGARVEPRALVTEVEIQRSAAEPEWLRTQVELMDRRVTVEARELGAEVEPLAGVDSGRVHSMKAVKSFLGPSSDDSALLVVWGTWGAKTHKTVHKPDIS